MHSQPTTAGLAAPLVPCEPASDVHGPHVRGPWRGFQEPLKFAALFALLNVVMNSRYPARQPLGWYFLPSLDVVGVLTVIALFAAWGRPVPRVLRGAFVALFLFARALRVADGVETSAFFRNFNFVVDSPLLLEFMRLLRTTVPLWLCVLAGCAGIGLLVLLGFLLNRGFRQLEVSLGQSAPLALFACVTGTFALASSFEWQPPRDKGFPVEIDRRLVGAFGSSIFSRFGSELDFAENIYGYRNDKVAGIQQQEALLAASPNDLRKLAGRNVYLFVLESYGECVVDRASLAVQVLPAYARFEQDLTQKGFQIATRVLDSSTYGGRSWLAHATLSTGVRTSDQFQFELLRVAQPHTLTDIFADAGYRTVLVQPATNRSIGAKDIHHFAAHYYGKDFGYTGPKFAWSPMPDQLVLDFVRRRELVSPQAPLFLEYALTSSHVPWSEIPPMIEDWSALGNGAIYRTERGTHFENGWLDLGGAGEAYGRSVVYDFEVLRRYLSEFVTDDSLVIILGDHQPHSEVTLGDPAMGVPVHVLSKDAALLEPFRARGYAPGMRAATGTPRAGLETFMTDFVSDFSLARASGER